MPFSSHFRAIPRGPVHAASSSFRYRQATRGTQPHIEHIVAGDVFGEFEFVAAGLGGGRAIRRSSARVLVPADLYRIPFALLAPLLAETDAVRGRLIKLSMDRLISALNVKSTHLLGDRDVAFANWLLDAADNLGIAEGRHVQFSRPIGQREIAEALGVTRETMSLRLNEWERAGLLNTGGQSQRLEILDYPRIALRAAIHKDTPQQTIDAAIEEVDADLSRGDLVRARNIALDMLMFFPASPELRHRVALANVRAGNVRDALAGLAHGGYATGGDIALLRERVRLGLRRPGVAPDRLFFGSGEPLGEEEDWDEARGAERRLPTLVEDLAAIEARAQKELAFATSDQEARLEYAAASAEYYATIFAAVGGTYAGINAAMMAHIAGDTERSERSPTRSSVRSGRGRKATGRTRRSARRISSPGIARRRATLSPPRTRKRTRQTATGRRRACRSGGSARISASRPRRSLRRCRSARRRSTPGRSFAAHTTATRRKARSKPTCAARSRRRLPRKASATSTGRSPAAATSSSPRRRWRQASSSTSCCRSRWSTSSRPRF